MTWKQMNDYYIQNTLNYRVSKAFNAGIPNYTAWTPDKKYIETVNNAAQAKIICEEHVKN